MRFRTKMFVAFTFLSLALLTVTAVAGYRLVEERLISDATIQLTNESRLVIDRIDPVTDDRELQRVVTHLGEMIDSRITVITPDGVVHADSGVTPEHLTRIDNHRHRPEVADALSRGTGSSIRYSDTVKQQMLYVASRVDQPPPGRIVRLALPLTTIETLKKTALKGALLPLFLTLAGSLLLSAALARLVTRPLSRMAVAADRLGIDAWSLEVPLTGTDEIAQLGRALNRMAKRIEQQLKTVTETTQELETIVQTMGEGLVVLDENGFILLANRSFLTSFGIPPISGTTHISEACRTPDLLTLYQLHCERREELTGEVHHSRSNTTYLTHFVPLPDRNGTIAVFLDISELKRLEQIRKDFVANVSHELKTPVSVIKGYAETILSERMISVDPATTERFIRTIHDHAERLALLIRDLLSLSRLESGTAELEKSPVDLADLITTTTNVIAERARKKSITIEVVPPPPLPIPGHRQYMEQAILNLLDNALTYTPPGGRIEVSTSLGDDTCTISVTDTGTGIPPEHLTRIFERFYRVDQSRSRAEGGTGLGLAIVKHIMQLHGGRADVTSTPGAGSTFSLRFPRN